jgi:hypothetical protein
MLLKEVFAGDHVFAKTTATIIHFESATYKVSPFLYAKVSARRKLPEGHGRAESNERDK